MELSSEQKLKKIIGKAIEKGWMVRIQNPAMNSKIEEVKFEYGNISIYFRKKHKRKKQYYQQARIGYGFNEKELLLSHNFAKAYFGENLMSENINRFLPNTKWALNYVPVHEGYIEFIAPKWQYHLQQAVLSKDIIDYYYKHLAS